LKTISSLSFSFHVSNLSLGTLSLKDEIGDRTDAHEVDERRTPQPLATVDMLCRAAVDVYECRCQQR
jgi:hypothetical protein